MIKHEIRVELTNTDDLTKIINKAYFKEGFKGKITGSNKHFISIEDDVNKTIFTGLHNATVKIMNEELIDGAMRFRIEDDKGIRLYPISIYCIKIEDRYSFY